jgi:hypothetical protein
MLGHCTLRGFLRLGLLATALPGSGASAVDATQAETLLQFLAGCRAGPVSSDAVERVLALPGTQLIIGQQNISRRITAAQYRVVLAGACRGEVATITPSEPGRRAEKGMEGLLQDVAPSLLWGREHIPRLEERLIAATRNADLGGIIPLVRENLPQAVDVAPRFYFVMGGRAGAAASDQGIYIDLLSTAWRSREGSSAMALQEMIEYFAHETHHIGYGRILDQKRERLRLAGSKERAWSFLVNVMMEGSATLLISAHGRWTDLESMGHIQPDLARLPQLLARTQDILQRSLSGAMTEEDFERAVSEFFGEGYHAVGARLLSAIEAVRGKPAVLQVMADPRTLLSVYNDCAKKRNDAYLFDLRLAEDLKTLGEAR